MLVQQVPIAHHYAHDGVRTDVHSRCLLLPRKNVATFWSDIVGRSVCDPYPDENQKNLVV